MSTGNNSFAEVYKTQKELREELSTMRELVEQLQTQFDTLKVTVSYLKSESEETSVETKSFLRKFPLSNLKTYQYLHSVQLLVANLQEQLSRKTKEHEKILSNLARKIDELDICKRNENTHDEDIAERSCNTSSTINFDNPNDVTKVSKQVYRKNSTNNQSLVVNNPDINRLSGEVQKLQPLEHFIHHLHERIKTLECGRNGKTIWRISGFDAIFQNGKRQHVGLKPDSPKQPDNFYSPLIYTSQQGYLFYLRLYPFGCDSAAGKFVSIFLAFSPGEYDAILEWPFTSTIEISVVNQQNLSDKWTQSIAPCDKNIQCFQRPLSKNSNLAVGLLCFMPHRLETFISFPDNTLA